MKLRTQRERWLGLAAAALLLTLPIGGTIRTLTTNDSEESSQVFFHYALRVEPGMMFGVEMLSASEGERLKDVPVLMDALARELVKVSRAGGLNIFPTWDAKAGELVLNCNYAARTWIVSFEFRDTYWARGVMDRRILVLEADTFMARKQKAVAKENLSGLQDDAARVNERVGLAMQAALSSLLKPARNAAPQDAAASSRARLLSDEELTEALQPARSHVFPGAR